MADFNFENFWAEESAEHIQTAQKTFDTLQENFRRVLEACETCVITGGKILFFGNGGSAADAQHLATELAVRYVKDRTPIPSLALTTDTSALTAIGNDMGFEALFSRQIEAIGKAGDVAIGLSTSGNSKNVLAGLRTAQKHGLVTIGFTGKDGGKMNDVCDTLLVVPSSTTARIQEMHITLGQMLCAALEKKLGLV